MNKADKLLNIIRNTLSDGKPELYPGDYFLISKIITELDNYLSDGGEIPTSWRKSLSKNA